MGKNLVIVESPAKAKTIENYLGPDFTVLSSVGHIRDLATTGPGGLGVDVEDQFKPNYKNVTGKSKIIKELKKVAKASDSVYLATDPDREGEAISWHLADVLGLDLDLDSRVVFNEITKDAILEAFKHPRKVDMDLVKSQESRRILDRIIGFKLSKLLQSKIKSKSAGRVQSVALKLIVEKEKEVLAFTSEEYWTISAMFGKDKSQFEAELMKKNNKNLEIKNEEEVKAILAELTDPYIINRVEKKNKFKQPKTPFITSTLQQEAHSRLGYNAKKTMTIAQKLYEGVDIGSETVGLITYMRTDSTRLSDNFVDDAKKYVKDTFGADYVGTGTVAGKKVKNAQDAHEAIRPTAVHRTPEELKSYLKRDELRLYKLIWERAVASLMKSATVEATTMDVLAQDYLFRVNGQVLVFDGYLRVYSFEETKNSQLPKLAEGDVLSLLDVEPQQHFTQPPARYSEAKLIKEMEELGIGRPSTYAQTMETLKNRGYVAIQDKKFMPTDQGILTSDKLSEFFSEFINVEYTAGMERNLDEISKGQRIWYDELKVFYDHFIPMLDNAQENMEKIAPVEIGEDCPECGAPLVMRRGRYGEFVACSAYPTCKYIKKEAKEEVVHVSTGVKCPKCETGEIVEKKTRRGKLFYGCSKYPDCDFALWHKPNGRKCPTCDSLLVVKGKKEEVQCPDKECGYKES
ncbi:MAG: type I DNA topoisomerase [Turicibacter sp.]